MRQLLIAIILVGISSCCRAQFYTSIGFHTDKGFNQTLGVAMENVHVNFSSDVPFFSREEKIILSLNGGYQFFHNNWYALPSVGVARVVYDDFTKEQTRVMKWRPIYATELGYEKGNGSVYINTKYVDKIFFGIGVRVYIFNNN